jgi:hypothetical protein
MNCVLELLGLDLVLEQRRLHHTALLSLPLAGSEVPIPEGTIAASPSSLGAPLGRPGQVTFLVSPVYGKLIGTLRTLLTWSLLWHQKLGVGMYVLYVTEIQTQGVWLQDPQLQVTTMNPACALSRATGPPIAPG